MATLQMNILSMKLGMQSNFSVILPSFIPCRENAGKTSAELYPRDVRFQTLWLLPTEYGDDMEALKYTAIQRYADEHSLAVVLPAPLNKLYSDDPGNQKFTEYITDELWSVCHGTFALSKKREDNFIGGFGLGAYGALKAAMRYPEKYSKVLLIGGAFGDDLKNTYLKDVNAKIAAEGLIPHMPLDDALPEDAEIKIPAGVELPEVSIRYAKDSELSGYASAAAENLKAAGVKVTVKAFDGTDSWAFRDLALGEAITDLFEEV